MVGKEMLERTGRKNNKIKTGPVITFNTAKLPARGRFEANEAMSDDQ